MGGVSCPVPEQLVVSSATASGDALEREVYLLRRMMAKRLGEEGLDWRADTYFCSLSTRTIVYKAMVNAKVKAVWTIRRTLARVRCCGSLSLFACSRANSRRCSR